MIRAHHQLTIDRLAEHYGANPRYLALIVGGSVAKGTARDDSDVDVVLVTTPEEFQRCHAAGEHFLYATDFCEYEGGYIDGKYVDEQFILDCADHGSEPARWAFTNAFVAYSHIPGLEDLIKRIPVYQEHERQRKLESFYSQVLILPWFMGEAEAKNDSYLLHQSAADMVLFAGRLILAHNRLLFPCHKSFMRQVERAEIKPEGFKTLADTLLAHPSKALATDLFDLMHTHYGDQGMTWSRAITRFVQDSEWNWRNGHPPLQDC